MNNEHREKNIFFFIFLSLKFNLSSCFTGKFFLLSDHPKKQQNFKNFSIHSQYSSQAYRSFSLFKENEKIKTANIIRWIYSFCRIASLDAARDSS